MGFLFCIDVWLLTGPDNHDLNCASSDEKEEEEYEKEEVGEDGEIVLVSGDKVFSPWNKSGAVPPPAAPVGESNRPHYLTIIEWMNNFRSHTSQYIKHF